jgi:hypothetical protein
MGVKFFEDDGFRDIGFGDTDSRDTDSKDSGSEENSDCIGFEAAILRGTSSSKILRSNSP